MSTPRHDFYESDERVTISVYIRGANPDNLKVNFTPSSLDLEYEESKLSLSPLKGTIDPEASGYTVGKVKIEIRLQKTEPGRWAALERTAAEQEAHLAAFPPSTDPEPVRPRQHKNWEKVTDEILTKEKEKTTNEDPNAGGDAALNGFFQNLYQGADEDSRRAMMKSFVESGGTTLSTNWDEVKKEEVTVKPPDGSEWRKWGA